MEVRSLGSNARSALDSDQTRPGPQYATLLNAGVATPASGSSGGRAAVLAFIPPDATAASGPGEEAGPRAEVPAPPGTPILLETGDIVLLGSQGLRARLPDALLKSSLLALARGDPRITAQDLAEFLVRLAEARP